MTKIQEFVDGLTEQDAKSALVKLLEAEEERRESRRAYMKATSEKRREYAKARNARQRELLRRAKEMGLEA